MTLKLKNKLPYYDRFPLTLPIEQYSDGFLGINLHYLSILMRIRLLDRLMIIVIMINLIKHLLNY